MKITKRCMLCGADVELFNAEKIGDVWDPPDGLPPITVVDESELGWWFAMCPECDYEYDVEFVEDWVEGKIDAFVVSMETADEVRSFLRSILTDCPEAREIAQEVLKEQR